MQAAKHLVTDSHRNPSAGIYSYSHKIFTAKCCCLSIILQAAEEPVRWGKAKFAGFTDITKMTRITRIASFASFTLVTRILELPDAAQQVLTTCWGVSAEAVEQPVGVGKAQPDIHFHLNMSGGLAYF